MQRNLQECLDLEALGNRLCSRQEPHYLGAELVKVPSRALRRTQPRALDVEDAMPLREPARDMVAGRAVLGEPVVAEVQDCRRFHERPTQGSGVVKPRPQERTASARRGSTWAPCG